MARDPGKLVIVVLVYILCTSIWLLWSFEPPPSRQQTQALFSADIERLELGDVDCTQTYVPCFVNSDCHTPCTNGHEFLCVYENKIAGTNGHCARKSAGEITTKRKECTQANGLIPVMENVDGILQETCASMYPDIINNEGHTWDWVCNDGVFTMDFASAPFHMSCVCKKTFTTVWFVDSPTIPRCVHIHALGHLRNVFIRYKVGKESM